MNGRMGAPVNSIMALRLNSPPRPSVASTRTVNARPKNDGGEDGVGGGAEDVAP